MDVKVVPGGGQAFDREDLTPSASVVHKFIWPEGSRPPGLKIILRGCTHGESALFFCLDAPDLATATTWLAGAAGEQVDTQRRVALSASVIGGEQAGEPGGKNVPITADMPLSDMYYILEAADATAKLFVEAS